MAKAEDLAWRPSTVLRPAGPWTASPGIQPIRITLYATVAIDPRFRVQDVDRGSECATDPDHGPAGKWHLIPVPLRRRLRRRSPEPLPFSGCDHAGIIRGFVTLAVRGATSTSNTSVKNTAIVPIVRPIAA